MSLEAQPPSRATGPSYGFSIRTHLLRLIAAVILPMLALAGVLAWYYGSAARQTIEAERLDVANNLANLLDREIGTLGGFLNGLSISPGFRSGDAGVVEVTAALARERGFEVLALFDRAGALQLVVPPQARDLLVSGAAAGVPEVIGGRSLYLSDLKEVAAAKPGLFFLSVPVVVDGRVAYVLSGGVSPKRLQALFAEAGLRPGWGGGIVDRSGILVARSRDANLYVGKPAQPPMAAAAKGEAPSGLFDVVDRDGIDVRNSFYRSPISGWTAGVAVPASVVNAPMWQTAMILAVAAAFFILVSLLLALLVARRITQAVHQLGQAVVAFATGEPVAVPATTLTELRDVLSLIEGTAAVGPSRPYPPNRG